jgi:ABC-type polysaccharide/polyol phosphate transport system ATPase subunit
MTKTIEIRNLGKKYIISHEKEAMVRHIFPRLLGIKKYEEFWALQDINLEINKGECLGIIGRNGAGKTTLLNILAGITSPTHGKVLVNGKISAILTLGAGFHPELTGEENVYLNASILGLSSKEIKRRFNEIVEFSELKDFIDAPLKTYSTGMYMRLGFAIAINVDFDILLIDEILTVGDLFFQEKCLNKLKELRKKGKTLVFVSQSPDLLNILSNFAILLDKGKIILVNSPKNVTEYYQREIFKEIPVIKKDIKDKVQIEETRITDEGLNKEINVSKDGWRVKMGSQDAQITKVSFFNGRLKETNLFHTGEKLKVVVEYVVKKEIEDPHFGVAIFTEDGLYCYGPNTRFDKIKIKRLKVGRGEFSIKYKRLNLLPGQYRVSVAIWEKDEKFAYDYHRAYYKFEVVSDKKDHGALYLDHKWHWKLP